MAGVHLVPAAQLLTVVHLPAADGTARTACAQPTDDDQLWVPYPYDPVRDRLCPDCAAGRPMQPVEPVPDVPLFP